MDIKDIKEKWETSNKFNPKTNQISIRFPVVTKAKVEALSDLYPNLNKNELITDLLSLSLNHMNIDSLLNERLNETETS